MNHPRSACLFAAAAVLLTGCARDSLDEAAMRASQVGTAVGDARPGIGNAALDAGSAITARYYFVAKYEATQSQRAAVEAVARRAAPRASATARAKARPAPRYLAVRTRPDARAKTATSVMLWDTQSAQIVGNAVYDLNETPPAQALVKFETYSAAYVGTEG